ncbi:MAG: replicative DNA helicase [Tissierellia bacterium]|nr:replicative DNA helicase [Tissierellia bacterium]
MEQKVGLPQSLEAELTLLSNMINDPESIDMALEIIKTEDEFFYRAHKLLFRSMTNLHNRGRQVNRVTLTEDLKTTELLDEVGGLTYIVEVADAYLTSAKTKDMALLVHEKYLFRKLVEASMEIREEALAAKGEVRDVLAAAEDRILNLGLNTGQVGLEPVGKVLKSAADELVRRSKLEGELSGVSTGFKDLDVLLNGFQKSDLILLAARPSMGKTAIAINFAVSAAQAGKKVAVFSLEMSKEQLAMRIFSQLSNIDLSRIFSGNLEGEDWKRISVTMNEFSPKEMHIDDTSGVTVTEIRSRLRRMKMEQGLDLVMIDYLQLMEGGGNSENRQQEISKISRGLKGIAKELEVPVIALSQLSRAPEQRSDHRPILSDLRESGAIEQDADVVMFLYRDEYYHPDTEYKGIGEVIIAKHRNGPIGNVKLVYKAENTKFLDFSYRQD